MRLRYRIAYWLRLLAYKIEPPALFDGKTLSDLIHDIEPEDTPVLTDPDFRLVNWDTNPPDDQCHDLIVDGDHFRCPNCGQGVRNG
jgi:hypothetical protein